VAQTMKAAVVEKPGVMRVKEVPVPEINDDEVLIRVKYVGICGTDLSIYTGKYSAEFLPLIPGHEFSGVIEKVGANAKDLKVGDRVTADINMSCGTCFYCRRGQKLMCRGFTQLGIHTDGAYAEYVKAPWEQVHVLPDNLSFELGAFIEPVSCLIHSAKAMNVAIGSSVAVIGNGALGILHGVVEQYRGAAPTIVVGVNEKKLQIAKQMGVDYVVNSTKVDPVEEVRRLTGGRGADYVIEAVGKPETYELALEMVRPGGTVAAFGITAGDDTITVRPFDLVLGEKNIVGSCAGVGNDWSDSIALLQYGRIKPEPLFTLKVPLEELEDAIKLLQTNRNITKVLVSPDLTKREVLGEF